MGESTGILTQHDPTVTQAMKQKALELYSQCLSKRDIAQQLGFAPSCFTYWEDTDPEFKIAVEDCKETFADRIRYRLAQFAQRSDKIGMVTNFFLARAYCPEHFDRRYLSGRIEVNHTVSLQGMPHEPIPQPVVYNVHSQDIHKLDIIPKAIETPKKKRKKA